MGELFLPHCSAYYEAKITMSDDPLATDLPILPIYHTMVPMLQKTYSYVVRKT